MSGYEVKGCIHRYVDKICVYCNNVQIKKRKLPDWLKTITKRKQYHCIHNKSKYTCKECNCSLLCKHKKRRDRCKECGGSSICSHGRRRSTCKECGGSAICSHGRLYSTCKECGGSSICSHGRIRSQCKECGGGSICSHGRIRSKCKECGGSSICSHGRRRSTCKECGGSAICSHGRIRSTCNECVGYSICSHGRIRSQCKECRGGSICSHERVRSKCKECRGGSICSHGHLRSRCKECGGSALCKSEWCFTRKNPKNIYKGYCVRCCIYLFPDMSLPRNYKTKENTVTDEIISRFPDKSWIRDKKIEYGCSLRRPDVFLDLGSHILIVEVDEHQHHEVSLICENKRIMELSKDVNHRPIVFLRFNPDGYIRSDGYQVKSCWTYDKNGIIRVKQSSMDEWKARLETLIERIDYWLHHETKKTVEKEELFYSEKLND